MAEMSKAKHNLSITLTLTLFLGNLKKECIEKGVINTFEREKKKKKGLSVLVLVQCLKALLCDIWSLSSVNDVELCLIKSSLIWGIDFYLYLIIAKELSLIKGIS
jgi:RNA recognition motif-containing protein